MAQFIIAFILGFFALAPHAWAQASCPTPNPNTSAWTSLTGPRFQGVDSNPSVNCSLPAGGLNGAFQTMATAIQALPSTSCPSGWTCVTPTGAGNLTTGTDADHAVLQAAATNSATSPVLLHPGIYYNCSTINIPRYGVFGHPYITGWVGGGAPGWVPSYPVGDPVLMICGNPTSTTSMIHLHDNTKLQGFSMQGNRQASASTDNMTCVDAINSTSATITNMQFYDCHNGIDLSSSSTPGDQGSATLDTVLKHLAFDYTDRGIFSTTVNGGNGTTDQHWDDLEFEVSLNGGVYMNNGMDGQILNVRAEDTGGQYGLYINGGLLQIDHVWCNNMACMNLPTGSVQLSNVTCYSQFATTWCIIAGNLNSNSVITNVRCQYPAGSGRCVYLTGITQGNISNINCSMVTSDPCVWFAQAENTDAILSGINVCFSGNCGNIEIDTHGFTSAFQIRDTDGATVVETGTFSGFIIADDSVSANSLATAQLMLPNSPDAIHLSRAWSFTIAAGAGQIPTCTSSLAGLQVWVTDAASDISAGAGGGSVKAIVTCMNTAGSTYAWKGFAGT